MLFNLVNKVVQNCKEKKINTEIQKNSNNFD